jgi:hypothetical protein
MNIESITIVIAMALFFMAMVTLFDNANKK